MSSARISQYRSVTCGQGVCMVMPEGRYVEGVIWGGQTSSGAEPTLALHQPRPPEAGQEALCGQGGPELPAGGALPLWWACSSSEK